MFQHVLTGFNWMPLDSLIVLLIPPRIVLISSDLFTCYEMIWGGRITTLHYDFPWFFDGFSMVFAGFSRIFSTSWCHRHVLQAWILGNRATFAPNRAMTRSCWRRPQSMQTPNTVPLVFWYVLMCFDVFCSYTSYHFVHCHTCLGDLWVPKGQKMVTFCRGNATFATFCCCEWCECCECCGQFCRCTARGRGQAGDEDASSGSKARQRASYGTKTELILWDRKQRDAQEMIQRKREHQKISQSWSRELMYRVWQSVKDSNSWHVEGHGLPCRECLVLASKSSTDQFEVCKSCRQHDLTFFDNCRFQPQETNRAQKFTGDDSEAQRLKKSREWEDLVQPEVQPGSTWCQSWCQSVAIYCCPNAVDPDELGIFSFLDLSRWDMMRLWIQFGMI